MIVPGSAHFQIMSFKKKEKNGRRSLIGLHLIRVLDSLHRLPLEGELIARLRSSPFRDELYLLVRAHSTTPTLLGSSLSPQRMGAPEDVTKHSKETGDLWRQNHTRETTRHTQDGSRCSNT